MRPPATKLVAVSPELVAVGGKVSGLAPIAKLKTLPELEAVHVKSAPDCVMLAAVKAVGGKQAGGAVMLMT